VTPGDRIEVSIEKNVYRGLGLGHHEGRVVFVSRVLAGDRVEVRIEAVERGFVRGVVERVLVSSPNRRVAPCPVADLCGGCAYQHARYESQPAVKAAILRETFARAGVRWTEDVPVVTGPEKGWRVRTTLHFSVIENSLRIGFRREGSHEVVEISSCLQISARLRRVAERFGEELRQQPMLWRHLSALELAESSDGKVVVAILVGDLGRAEMASLASLARIDSGLGGFGFRSARRSSELTALVGSPYVTHEVLGRSYRVHASSFFQGNRFLVGDLTAAVRDAVPEGSDVVELFAGVGLFTAALLPRVSRVRAVEIAQKAAEDFRFNLGDSSAAALREGDALVGLELLRPGRHEHIVLDPPRAGAGHRMVEAIVARKPEGIVYLSCDPTTLARDLAGFRKAGYDLADVRLFDLFPDTFHLETLVRLRPA
jgi:23S rRNA (uracil1939-C5)-methyltransferase